MLRISSSLWLIVLLYGCSDNPDPLVMSPDQRQYDTAQLLRGEKIYNQNCATCHGPGATGDPNWRQRGADGRFPPPPLNGTAHTWHHPLAQLRHTIKNGGVNMPAWGRVLSDAQINDILAYVQSLWPDEAYAAWYGIEQRTQK